MKSQPCLPSTLAAGLLCACAGYGQSAPRFEVASVKPNPSPALRHVLRPPAANRLSTRNAPLRLLIQNAYGVQTFQISGGPGWIDSAGYDIEAKAEGNPGPSQIWLMLQSLLEDRFNLKVHRQTKELPVYVLTAAKSGPMLATPQEGSCKNADTTERVGPAPLPCGRVGVGAERSGMFLRGAGVDMAEFTKVLSTVVGRTVLDRSGVAGKFDVNLEFAYDEMTIGIPRPSRRPDSGQPPDGPSIMAALQKQLGLKIQPAKGPVEILVIDHVERPSEN
jgi:uncharacterized protein (TIGR03435 family)